MAAPVVAGTVALMLQANPTLTPNLVKAILEYTAQVYPGYDALTQGAGFLNTKGAVDLARFFETAQAGQAVPDRGAAWSKKIIWGNHRITDGVIKPNANAWKSSIVWGAATIGDGENIVWGTAALRDGDNIVWGTLDSTATTSSGARSDDDDNIVWGTFASVDEDNIVWGTLRDDGATSCGARRAAATTATTSSGARRARCATTSCGAPSLLAENIVWGTTLRRWTTTSSGARRTETAITGHVGNDLGVDDADFDVAAAPPDIAPVLDTTGSTPSTSTVTGLHREGYYHGKDAIPRRGGGHGRAGGDCAAGAETTIDTTGGSRCRC